jgi:hypothetical protein
MGKSLLFALIPVIVVVTSALKKNCRASSAETSHGVALCVCVHADGAEYRR